MNGLKLFGWCARVIYQSGVLHVPILRRRINEKVFDAWIENLFQRWSYPVTLPVRAGDSWVTLEINPRDGIIERHILTKGSFDQHLIDTFAANIYEDDTVVDVGANIGYYSLIFSSIVGKRGSVIACEPFPRALRHLKKNFSYNPDLASRITLLEVACSNKKATFHMEESEGNLGGSSVHEGGSGVSVPGDTLDSLLKGMARVSFIKIDIEGYEKEALEGAQETIAKHRPRIVFEYSPSLYATMSDDPNERALETCNSILKHSYTFSVIERDSRVTPITDVEVFVRTTKKQKNILCTPLRITL